MTTRVIQWATGAVGSAQLQQVIDSPGLELAGVLVYDPGKAGQDAGTLVGRPRTGILATVDKAAVVALDADVVLHAASKAYPGNTNLDDIVALLESGKDVIATTSYSHLPGVAGGQLAVAATAIRAIPAVRAAPPGVVTAPVFGATSGPAADRPSPPARPAPRPVANHYSD